MDFLHEGIQKKHYKRAAQYLQAEMDVDVHCFQAVDGSNLILTDQEKALVSGLSEGFHSPTEGPPKYLLCLIHMERNLNDYLIKRVDQVKTNKIKNAVFGKEGIVKTSKSRTEFDEKFEALNQMFGHHFEERRLKLLEEKLWEFAVNPAILFPHLKDQSSNLVESENARLKRLTEHKSNPIDQLTLICENKQQGQVRIFQLHSLKHLNLPFWL